MNLCKKVPGKKFREKKPGNKNLEKSPNFLKSLEKMSLKKSPVFWIPGTYFPIITPPSPPPWDVKKKD